MEDFLLALKKKNQSVSRREGDFADPCVVDVTDRRGQVRWTFRDFE